jgi:hypothetical protein
MFLGALCAAIALAISFLSIVDAEQETTKTARGGLLAKTGKYQFEVFFYPAAIRVFPQDGAGKALDASRLTMKATFYYLSSAKPWFSRVLRAPAVAAGQASSYLEHNINLRNAPASGAKVAFEVSGLPDPAESTATFTVPFEFAAAPTAAPGGGSNASRYVYRPGYLGYGYYSYEFTPGQNTNSLEYSAYTSPSSGGSSSGSFDTSHRDWSTGRDNLPISKPWLRPFD